MKQRIQALLLRQGTSVPAVASLWHGPGAQWLAAVTLPGRAGESLVGWRRLLQHLTRQVVRVDRAVRRAAQGDPVVAALQALPGIGPVLGLTIRAEIGDIMRFPDAPHLASYAGVVPRVCQSGTRRFWTGPLTKHGSPSLRWALIEPRCTGPNDRTRWASGRAAWR